MNTCSFFNLSHHCKMQSLIPSFLGTPWGHPGPLSHVSHPVTMLVTVIIKIMASGAAMDSPYFILGAAVCISHISSPTVSTYFPYFMRGN